MRLLIRFIKGLIPVIFVSTFSITFSRLLSTDYVGDSMPNMPLGANRVLRSGGFMGFETLAAAAEEESARTMIELSERCSKINANSVLNVTTAPPSPSVPICHPYSQLMTVSASGQLGNHMSQYATLLALSATNGFQAAVQKVPTQLCCSI